MTTPDTGTAEPPEVTDEPQSYDARKLAQDGPEWFGCLTIENAEAVAGRLRRMLDGKLYAWAFDWLDHGDLELHTSMKARNIRVTHKADYAMVSWNDGYGLHSWYTTIRDRAEGQRLSYEEQRKHSHYLHFRPECFTSETFAPAGNKVRSTFRIEYPEHLSDDYN